MQRRHRAKDIRATAPVGRDSVVDIKKLFESVGRGKDVIASFDWKTVPQGAATSMWARVVAPPDEMGAKYCEDCQVAEVNDALSSKTGVRSYALDSIRFSHCV